MNNVQITGRLTKDPELKYTQSGKAICNISVAVRRDFKSENGEYESDFFNCQAWDKKAELIGEHFRKGSMIGITGRLQNSTFEDENKQKRTITRIIIEKMDFLSAKKNENTSGDVETVDDDDSEFPF